MITHSLRFLPHLLSAHITANYRRREEDEDKQAGSSLFVHLSSSPAPEDSDPGRKRGENSSETQEVHKLGNRSVSHPVC